MRFLKEKKKTTKAFETVFTFLLFTNNQETFSFFLNQTEAFCEINDLRAIERGQSRVVSFLNEQRQNTLRIPDNPSLRLWKLIIPIDLLNDSLSNTNQTHHSYIGIPSFSFLSYIAYYILYYYTLISTSLRNSSSVHV